MADAHEEKGNPLKMKSLDSQQKGSVAEEETESIKMLNAKEIMKRNFASRATTTALIPDDDSSLERRFKKLSHINSKGKLSKLGSNKSGIASKSVDLEEGLVKSIDIQSPIQSVKHINEKLPNLDNDLKYTKLFLQKQGLHNVSL